MGEKGHGVMSLLLSRGMGNKTYGFFDIQMKSLRKIVLEGIKMMLRYLR